MKTKTIYFITAFMMLLTLSVSASVVQELDYSDPTYWVELLTVVAVWLAALVVKKVAPQIPDLLMLTVVGLLSASLSYLSNIYGLTSNGWVIQFLAGFGATFLDQIIKKLKAL